MDENFKHDVAIGVADELGDNFSKQAEAAQIEIHRTQGAIQMCIVAAKSIENLSAQIDADIDNMSAEEYQSAKKWVKRCYGAMLGLQNQVEVKSHTYAGKVLGLQQASEQAAKEAMKHRRRKESLAEDVEEDEGRARILGRERPSGRRPENPLADRREQEPVDSEDSPAEDGAETEESLAALLKPDLQRLLKDRGLPTSGNKPELIERILNANSG